MGKVQNEGYCRFCNKEYSRRGMSQHLNACKAKKEQDKKDVETSETTKKETIYHIKLFSEGPYWLHIEMKASDTLEDLDDFLRNVWCECCGHLSEFIINGVYYDGSSNGFFSDWESSGKSWDVSLAKVLDVKSTFEYNYDFGATTHIKGKVINSREGILPEEVRILARNNPQQMKCTLCSEKATIIDGTSFKVYCEKCAEKDLEPYQRLPLANSPRVGFCAYMGDNGFDDWSPPDG